MAKELFRQALSTTLDTDARLPLAKYADKTPTNITVSAFIAFLSEVMPFLELNQSTRQTLNTSPSFADLIAGSLLIVGENKELKVLDGMTWDVATKQLSVLNNISIPISSSAEPSAYIIGTGMAMRMVKNGVSEGRNYFFAGAGNDTVGVLATTQYQGNDNFGMGTNALRSISLGQQNYAIGTNALFAMQTGSSCIAYGTGALQKLTIAPGTVGLGSDSLSNLLSGARSVGIGLSSGRFKNDGTANEVATNSLYIGANTKSKEGNVTNETVIGYGAKGKGSNTVTIGSDAVTDNYFSGNIKASGGVQIGNVLEAASELNAGMTRYRDGANFSVTEMSMKTGATTYAWIEQTRIEW